MALIDKNQYLQLRNQGLSKEEAVARLTPKQEAVPESGWSSVRIPEVPHFTQEEMGKASPESKMGMFAANIGAGALNIAGGVGNIALHPIETVSTIGKVGGGIIDVARGAETKNKELAKQAAGVIFDKYKSPEAFGKAFSEDPLSILGDWATVMTGGAGLVSKGAQLGKMAKISQFSKLRELGMAEEAAKAAESARKLSNIQATAGKVAKIGLKVDPYVQIPALGAKVIGKTIGGTAGFAKKSGLYLLAQKSGLNPDTIETITKTPQMFEKAQEGGISREGFGERLHGVLESKIQDLGETGAQYEPIRKSGIVVENPIAKVEDRLFKKGIKVKDGVLDFSSSNIGAKTDRAAIQGAYDIMKETPVTASANDILNLRQKLDGVIHWSAQTSKKGEEIVRGVIRSTVDSVAKDKIPGLKAVDEAYSPKIAELKDLQKEWFTKTPSGDIQLKPSAVSSIANLYKKGREDKLARLEQYMPGVGKEVKALAALEDTLNVQKVGTYTRGAGTGIGTLAGAMAGGPAGALAGVAYGLAADILTSPTVIVPILKAYGKTKIALKSTIDSAINKVKKGIKLNQTEKEVVKEAVKTKDAQKIVEENKIQPKVEPKVEPKTSTLDKGIDLAEGTMNFVGKKFKDAKSAKLFSVINKLPVGVMPVQNEDGTWSLTLVPRIGALLKGKKLIKEEPRSKQIIRLKGEGESMSIPEKSTIKNVDTSFGKYNSGKLEHKNGFLEYEISGNTMDIDMVKVKDRNKGTGTELMKEAERLAREKGLSKIQLSAQPLDNSISQNALNSFYEKNGYTHKGDNYFVKELSIPEKSLIEEAKKYKSAEEFVKAQPKVFHGTDADFTNFENKFLGSANGTAPINKTGFSFSSDMRVAETFGKNLIEARVDIKKPLVIDARGQDYSVFKDTLNRKLRNVDRNKYDGIIIKNYSDAGIYGEPKISDHYIPFSESQIKTKSQLLDIYNKAHNK